VEEAFLGSFLPFLSLVDYSKRQKEKQLKIKGYF
jgi:hypothetical protein